MSWWQEMGAQYQHPPPPPLRVCARHAAWPTDEPQTCCHPPSLWPLFFFNLIFPLLIQFAVRNTFYVLKTYGSA